MPRGLHCPLCVSSLSLPRLLHSASRSLALTFVAGSCKLDSHAFARGQTAVGPIDTRHGLFEKLARGLWKNTCALFFVYVADTLQTPFALRLFRNRYACWVHLDAPWWIWVDRGGTWWILMDLNRSSIPKFQVFQILGFQDLQIWRTEAFKLLRFQDFEIPCFKF